RLGSFSGETFAAKSGCAAMADPYIPLGSGKAKRTRSAPGTRPVRGFCAAPTVKIPPDSVNSSHDTAPPRGRAKSSRLGSLEGGSGPKPVVSAGRKRAAPGGSGMVARLEGNARQQALAGLKGWKEEAGRDAIAKEFRFADFNQAFAFMTQIALKAERMDHHPEWSNVYNRVSVLLSTHDCGGVSQRDIDMARFIDTLAA